MPKTPEERRERNRIFAQFLLDEDEEIVCYTPRGSASRPCLSVHLSTPALIWRLAREVFHTKRHDPNGETHILLAQMPTPDVAGLGSGVVLYWPGVPWDDVADMAGPDEPDDEDEARDVAEIQAGPTFRATVKG